MSERAPQSPERQEKIASPEYHHGAEKRAEKASEATHEQVKSSNEQLAKIRQEVQHEAVSGKDVAVENRSEGHDRSSQPIINHELKQHMFERTLVHVRKSLPFVSRSFSKVVHAKPVEAISSVGEKTLARPAGLLGGGLFALIGTAITLYLARHHGYRYNFLIFIMLFIGGYLLATIIELLGFLTGRQKRSRS